MYFPCALFSTFVLSSDYVSIASGARESTKDLEDSKLESTKDLEQSKVQFRSSQEVGNAFQGTVLNFIKVSSNSTSHYAFDLTWPPQSHGMYSLCVIIVLLAVAALLCGEEVSLFLSKISLPAAAPRGAEPDGGQPKAESRFIVSVDEATRMFLNGETAEQMEHARRVKKQQPDCSADQVWVCDESLWYVDAYMKFASVLWLLPKCLIFIPLMMLAAIPLNLLLRIYVRFLPIPCFQPDRGSWGYTAFVKMVVLIGIPMVVLATVSYLLDMVMYYFFSILFCSITCNWCTYCKSLAVLRPYRGGPSLALSLSDLVTVLMGKTYRHGFFEAAFMLSNCFTIIPWVKYFINANPFLYPLEERFLSQISTTMQDMSIEEIHRAGEIINVYCKLEEHVRRQIGNGVFSAHDPFPPPWKRWSIGMQSFGVDGIDPVTHEPTDKGLGLCLIFTHTTHARCNNGGSTEQFVLSNSAASPFTRAMLWYNNPYHHLTGWVEPNITTGLPQQPMKDRGGEHPMWMVTSHSPWHCNPDSPATCSSVNVFFTQWLPRAVRMVRKINRGVKIANELYQELHEPQNGICQPKGYKEVPYVPP